MNDLLLPDAISQLLMELVSIDSQNPDLVPGGAGECALAAHVVAWLKRRGVEAWIDEVRPGRCNAVARVRGGDGPTLALCAHLDTVSIDGMTMPALQPRLAEGKIYGRGAYDMKGGVTAIMAAIATLAQRPPKGTVLAALVADEEYASIGAQHFVSKYACDACIVTEASEGQLILAHKGFVWAEIETQGVAAHGSRWEDGVSAIGRIAPIITALEEYDRTELRMRKHPLLGPASMHCSMISGGDGWSTYAPHCTLRVERRTLPGEQPAQVLRELNDVVALVGARARVREVLSRSPLECPPDSLIAEMMLEAVTDVAGRAPQIAGVAYWMDAAIFADAGAATVDYGPTGAGAHGAVEWVELDSVVRCARVLANAAERFCNTTGARTRAAPTLRT